MTNEEAKRHLENVIRWEGSVPNVNALRMAIVALEKQKKYRWHDLRKNPNDLPDEEMICLLVDDCENMNLGYLSSYRTSDVFTGYKGVAIMQPIAWKYIDPFGVENDMD